MFPQSGMNTYVVPRYSLMRGTLALLGLSMIPTIFGAFAGLALAPWMMTHFIMSFIGMFALMFIFNFAITANRHNPLGVVLLMGFTFIMGAWLGPLLTVALHMPGGSMLIAMAAGGTAVVFLTLATVVTVTRKDFTFMGGFLMTGIILFLIASLVGMFFHPPMMMMTLSALGVLLFAGFMLYNLSQVAQGQYDSPVVAALQLYLDAMNLFISLLQLLMELSGNDRR